MEDIEVKAGKTRSLGDRLILTIDEGSIAFLSGAVFTADGRSVPNAKVELSRILEDGTTKKIDGRVTTETGSFKFRLSPDPGKYRVSVKADGAEPVTKDVRSMALLFIAWRFRYQPKVEAHLSCLVILRSWKSVRNS